MILEPKAKPVRIRIKIGKDEYSSVEELRDNFSVKDLFPLYLDGRLSRWLRQRGENALADKMDECSKTHRNESIDDYVYFISLFFEDVEEVLNLKVTTSENILAVFADEIHFDSLKLIVHQLCGIDGINWEIIFRPLISFTNYRDYFEDKAFHNLISDWGNVLSSLVRDEKEYKSLFMYLDQASNKNPEYGKHFSHFVKSSEKYDWYELFRERLVLDDLLRYYSFFPDLPGWANHFADMTSDLNSDRKRIKNVLIRSKDTETLLNYRRLLYGGRIHLISTDKPEKKDDVQNDNEWRKLAKNSVEYGHLEYILLTDNGEVDPTCHYSLEDYALGKDIIAFLRGLERLKKESTTFCYLEDLFLKREMKILECFASERDEHTGLLTDSGEECIISMIDESPLAGFVLQNESEPFDVIARKAVELIIDKLNENRK